MAGDIDPKNDKIGAFPHERHDFLWDEMPNVGGVTTVADALEVQGSKF